MEQSPSVDFAGYLLFPYSLLMEGNRSRLSLSSCAGRASVQVIPRHFLLIYRLERDIAKILHRLDSIEQSMRPHNPLHPGAPTVVTPPESNYEFRLGIYRNSARDDLHTEIPAETDAINVRRKSLLDEPNSDLSSKTTSLIHDLHKAANLPFVFADFLQQELRFPSVPFPLTPEGPLPVATQEEIDTLFQSYDGR
jgi:hypothetical protein